MRYQGKKALVLGLGKSGRAVCDFLEREGAETEGYDDRSLTASEVLYPRYDFAVISPGIDSNHPIARRLMENGVPVLSEIDLAYLNCASDRIFAVSGTNGKTTTCTILAAMLSEVGRCHLVGNIGVPFVSVVDRIGKRDLVVVEMSSFQIEQSVRFTPYCAALTSVGEDHLDRHPSAEAYQAIKRSLLERAQRIVVNADDPHQGGFEGAITYSREKESADFFLCGREIRHGGERYRLPEISRGAGYDADYLCAFSMSVSIFGFRKAFLRSYEQTKIPRYRNEFVGTLKGAKVFNDSKGTNIDATLFALAERGEKTAVILGGSDKGEDYSRLMREVGKKAVRIYLVGANAGDMYRAASPEVRGKCLPMEDLESCLRDFVEAPTEALLFSPASASFDRYENYEERGRVFDEILHKYISAK